MELLELQTHGYQFWGMVEAQRAKIGQGQPWPPPPFVPNAKASATQVADLDSAMSQAAASDPTVTPPAAMNIASSRVFPS